MGKGSCSSWQSIQSLRRAGALLGLCCLPTTAALSMAQPSSSGWLGGRSSRLSSSSPPAAFGYALPSRYNPPSFYPPNAPPPPEETHFDEAVAAARQSRARRMEKHPAFPETPTALAHEISGACPPRVGWGVGIGWLIDRLTCI